jgi:hypothetical protein
MSSLGFCAPCAAASPLPFSTGIGDPPPVKEKGTKKWLLVVVVLGLFLMLRK